MKRVMLALALVLLIGTPVFAADFAETACDLSYVVFCENFENRTLGYAKDNIIQSQYNNTGWAVANDTSMSVVNTQASDGTKSLQWIMPAGNSGAGFFDKTLPSLPEVWFRFYMKNSSNWVWSANGNKMVHFGSAVVGHQDNMLWDQAVNGGNNPSVRPQYATTDGPFLGPNMNGGFAWPLDTWVCVITHAKANTTNTGNDGLFEAWFKLPNGQEIQKHGYYNMNIDRDATTFASIKFSGYWNSEGGVIHPTMYRWVDNIIVSTQRIGCLGSTPTPGDTIKPSTPSAPTATASSSGTVTLAFTPPTDTGGSGLAGQTIQFCTGAACTPSTLLTNVSATATSYVHTGVAASTIYRYAIKGFDVAGNQGDYSAAGQVTTPAALQRTTLAVDDFERADSTELGTSWDPGYSTDDSFQIVSGRVRCRNLSNDCMETYNNVVTPDDQHVAITISIWSVTNTYPGTFTRAANSPTKTGYSCRPFSPGTSTVIHKWVAGTLSTLATDATYTWVNGDKLRQETTGSNPSVTKCYAVKPNGAETLVVTASDSSSPITSGKVGIIGYTTSALADMQYGDFAMGGFGSVTPPTLATIDATGRTSVTLTCGAVCPTTVRFVTGIGEQVTTVQSWSALPGGVYTYSGPFLAGLTDYIGAYPRDSVGVENVSGVIYDSVTAASTDTSAPVLSVASPLISVPAGTTSWGIAVNSDEPAQLRWATSDIAYDSMDPLTNALVASGGGLVHSFTATGLTTPSSTDYCIKGRDVSPAANTNTSCFTVTIAVAGSTADTTRPSTVTNLAATPISSSQIGLSHTASTDNSGGTITYHAFISTDGINYNLASIYTGNSTTLNGNAPNTTFYIKVLSQDPSLNFAADYSNVATVTTLPLEDVTRPSDMTGLAISATYQNSLVLRWTPGTDNQGSVTSNIEECSGVACSSFTQVSSGITVNELRRDLLPGTTYCFRGKHVDTSGNASLNYSSTVCGTTNAAGVGLPYPRKNVPLGNPRKSLDRERTAR